MSEQAPKYFIEFTQNINQRFDSLEHRFDVLEGRFGGMEKRMERIEDKLDVQTLEIKDLQNRTSVLESAYA